jgi:hypothetical protein
MNPYEHYHAPTELACASQGYTVRNKNHAISIYDLLHKTDYYYYLHGEYLLQINSH